MMEMILDDRSRSVQGDVARGPTVPVPVPSRAAAHELTHAVAPCGDSGLPGDPEAAHLQAADELLRRHGMSLAQCEVSRVYAGFDGGNDAVLFVVRVGRDVDVFALNEALTAVQLARGLSPSAQLDVVFQA